MSVTAKQLSKSSAQGKEIDIVIREQLQIIDDKLLRAPRSWGRNVVTHDLPTTLVGIQGLDKKDAQRVVYSAVLRSLDGRGFDTAIVLGAECTRLYIAWATRLSLDEVEAMNTLIRSRRLEPGAVEEFLTRRGGPREVLPGGREMRPRGGVVRPGDAETRAEPAPPSAAEAALLGGAGPAPPRG